MERSKDQLIKKTRPFIVKLMETSGNVDEWNENREMVKKVCPDQILPEMLAFVDGSRLIKRVLKSRNISSQN